MARSISVSEARRLLPAIIDSVSKDGGRVDITRRGVPVATIVRTSDLADHLGREPTEGNLAVEFACDPADLVSVVRELRGRVGRARSTVPRTAATKRRRR